MYTHMEKQKTAASVAEMAAAGNAKKDFKVIKLNEPNMKLMAEAALQLYQDGF